MKNIKYLKKNQTSSLNFFLLAIKKNSFQYFSRNKKNIFFKNKLLNISHNKFFLFPIFFDLVIFFRKTNKQDSPFIKYLKKKKTKKKIYQKNFLKIQKFKQINSYSLYQKFISFVFKVGKKNFWEHSFSIIFNNLSLKLQYSKGFLLSKIFIRLFTRVELKKVKSRKRISFIPFFITISRSLFLALKWIFLSALKNVTNISFKNKLYIELLQLLTLKSCFSLKKLEENNINAFNNRSNVHYRWNKSR